MLDGTTTHLHEPARARVDKAIVLMVSGMSISEVCKVAKISRSSFWRIRKTETFRRKLDQAQAAAFEQAVNVLHNSATIFAQALVEVCQDSKSRDSAKATAARSGLDSLWRAKELFDIDARLRRLEEQATEDREQ